MGFEKPPFERWVRFGGGEKQEKRVVGVLVDISVEDGKYGPGYVYSVLQADGSIAKFNGKTTFDRQIKARHVGKVIQLEWLGKETGKTGRHYDNIEFSVFEAASPEEYAEYKAMYPKMDTVTLDMKPALPPPEEQESFATVEMEVTDGGEGEEDDDDLPF